jgi:hypothetical protein
MIASTEGNFLLLENASGFAWNARLESMIIALGSAVVGLPWVTLGIMTT